MIPWRPALALAAWPLGLAAAGGPTAEVQRRDALRHDDACAADGGCAVNALQARSSVGAAHRGRQPAEDDGWVWPEKTAVQQMHGSEFTIQEHRDLYERMSPMINAQCPHYNAYFWPQISFWTQEVVRRAEAFPDGASASEQKKLQHFARDAAYLSCVWYFDPRKGNGDWSQPVAEYMQSVMDLPSTSLEVLDLPEFFHLLEGVERLKLSAVDACMMWTQAMSCDVGYFARDMKGNKDTSGKVCWDKVQRPPFSFSMVAGLSMIMPGLGNFNECTENEEFERDEYLECQQHPLTEDRFSWCPMGGHWHDGMWNSTWGRAAEPGSQRRSDINSCNKKLGNPEFASITPMVVHIADEGDDIDVMKPYQGYLLNMTQMTNLIDTVFSMSRNESDALEQNLQKAMVTAMTRALAKQAVKRVLGR